MKYWWIDVYWFNWLQYCVSYYCVIILNPFWVELDYLWWILGWWLVKEIGASLVISILYINYDNFCLVIRLYWSISYDKIYYGWYDFYLKCLELWLFNCWVWCNDVRVVMNLPICLLIIRLCKSANITFVNCIDRTIVMQFLLSYDYDYIRGRPLWPKLCYDY